MIFAKFQRRGSRVDGRPAGGMKTLGQSGAERGREKKKSRSILIFMGAIFVVTQYIMNFEKMSRGFLTVLALNLDRL